MELILPSTENANQLKGERIFLHPGEVYFGDSNCQIHTLLGSCIAITLWHPRLRVGGMCHFVLAGSQQKVHEGQVSQPITGRYSNDAMALLEKEVSIRNTVIKDYQAKIFGGSNMLTNSTLEKDEQIGNRNTQAALALLSKHNVNLLVAHVGETGHRRIVFDISTGDVWVKHTPLRKIIAHNQ